MVAEGEVSAAEVDEAAGEGEDPRSTTVDRMTMTMRRKLGCLGKGCSIFMSGGVGGFDGCWRWDGDGCHFS